MNPNLPTIAAAAVKRTPCIGRTFGRLLVIGRGGKFGKNRKWVCRCDCGVIKEIAHGSLYLGRTISCGCYNREKNQGRAKHSDTVNSIKSREYQCWLNIKQRCLNPRATAYSNYGGRGIRISDAWIDDYQRFLADVGRAPKGTTLDRINVDGDYEPGNVRWATRREQALNKRKTHHIVFEGVRYHYAQFAERFGLDPDRVNRYFVFSVPLLKQLKIHVSDDSLGRAMIAAEKNHAKRKSTRIS